MYIEIERIRKEAIADEFQLLLRNLYGLTEEYHE